MIAGWAWRHAQLLLSPLSLAHRQVHVWQGGLCAEGDEILLGVISQQALYANAIDLKISCGSAVFAFPPSLYMPNFCSRLPSGLRDLARHTPQGSVAATSAVAGAEYVWRRDTSRRARSDFLRRHHQTGCANGCGEPEDFEPCRSLGSATRRARAPCGRAGHSRRVQAFVSGPLASTSSNSRRCSTGTALIKRASAKNHTFSWPASRRAPARKSAQTISRQ